MQLAMPIDRLDDRRRLLAELDRVQLVARRKPDVLEGMDRSAKQAFQTILGGVADAFDLAKEDPHTVARYDTAPAGPRPKTSTRSGTTTTTTSTTPSRWASCCSWPAGCASAAAASSP